MFWVEIQSDTDTALEATAESDVDQRLNTLSTFSISIASDRFGIKEQQRTTKTTSAAPISKPTREQDLPAQTRAEGCGVNEITEG